MDKTPTNKPDDEQEASVIDGEKLDETKTEDKPVETLEEPVVAVEAEQPVETPAVAAEPVVTESSTPVVAPTTVAAPVSAEQPKSGSSAGLIILQWLTYAFWGWTILSLVWLVFIVLANFLTSQDTSSMVPYAIAAALVLLPISLVCDIFYGRHEPAKKTGAAMVVMVIHAVIFALFGIGMLISGVLVVVQTMIGTPSSDNLVWILTLFFSAAVYAVTFLRTLNPLPNLRISKFYPMVMAVVVGLFIVLGFVGPVAQAQLVKEDRLIEKNITSVYESVGSYVDDNKKLPQSLDEVGLSGEAKELVTKNLVTYRAIENPSEKKMTIDVYSNNQNRSLTDEGDDAAEYKFELCATYKKESAYYSSQYDNNKDTYEDYIYPETHPAGQVCYKLKKTDY